MVKKVSYFNIFYCIILLFMVTSCCTSRYLTTTNDVLEHQRRVTELEIECKRLRDVISSAQDKIGDSQRRVADIQVKAGGISDIVDRIEYLFREYESEVQRLLEGYDILRGAIEDSTEYTDSTGDSSTDMLHL